MARGLKSAPAGWSAATSAIVWKEISACRIRRSIRGAPEAMTFAENIVKFTFKVGDKIRPLTEKKGGGVWRRERSKRARSCWQEPQSRVLEGWSESLTGLQKNSKQLEELGREAARVSAPQRRHQRVDFKQKKKRCWFFKHKSFWSFFGGPNGFAGVAVTSSMGAETSATNLTQTNFQLIRTVA